MPDNVPLSNLRDSLLSPALTSHFEVEIQIPPKVNEFNGFLSKLKIGGTQMISNLKLMCCDASLPGSSLATHELLNDYTGVTQRNAYRRLYDDRADFTFYVDTSYRQIILFERWLQYISGETITNRSPTATFRMKYPYDYKTEIKITKFERNSGAKIRTKGSLSNTTKMEYVYINAFPSNINSIPVSYDNGQLLKCTVSFTYDRYVNLATSNSTPTQEADKPQSQPQPSFSPDAPQNPYIQSSFNIEQLAGTTYKPQDVAFPTNNNIPFDTASNFNSPQNVSFPTNTSVPFNTTLDLIG